MADRFTYSTIKPSSIDFETGANRLMQASVEQRLADIEQKRAMATESQKAVLDAMSVKKIQGMTRGLQERHQMDVDAHRKGIIDMVSKSGGTLTAPQQMQIKNEREDLETKAMASVQAVKERDDVRKFLLNPNTQYGYDVGAISAELKDWDDSFEKGEYKGDPRTILFKHQIEAPASDYVSKNYADLIDSLDVEELGEFKGNVFESTTLKGLEVSDPDSYDKVIRARDRMMQDPNIVRRYTANNGVVFEDKKKQVQAEIEDVISKKLKETSKGRTSTATASNKYKNAVDYTPSAFNYKGNDYSIVRIPSNISQTDRNFFVNEAKNLDSGKTEKLTQDNAKIVGVDVDNGVMLLEGKGGNAEKNGELVFIQEGTQPIKSKSGWIGSTEKQLGNKESQVDILKTAYEGNDKVKGVDNISLVPTENGYRLSGVIKTRKGDVPVEKVFTTFTDPSSTAIYEAPLWTNKEAVTNMFSKVLVKGKPLESYFDNPPEKKSETIVYNGETYTFDELKSAGWTDADIAKLKTRK